MTNNNSTPNSADRTKPAMGPTGDQTETHKLTWRERYAAQPTASNRLEFQGHEIRFHLDVAGDCWFVMVDIFRALGRRKTGPLRKRIKDPKYIKLVLAWVSNAASPRGGGGAMVQATNIKGIESMLGE